MAYAISKTVNSTRVNGRRHVLVTITETDVQTTSEGTIADNAIPTKGTIVRYSAISTVGGYNITPELGRAATFTDDGPDQIIDFGSGATTQNSVTATPYALSTPGTMYLRSNPASNGASVTTVLMITEGWD